MPEGFQFKGVEELRANLREISRAPFLQREVAIQLFQEPRGLINKSQPLVPVDTGALKGSKFVEPPEITGGTISVTLGYGERADAVP